MLTTDQLLIYLKERKGNWVSGESISNRLKVSRSAVWKHIGKLRAAGYVIESAPKKGYLLRETPDRPFPSEIREGLNTAFLGQHEIVYYKETDSTNTKAKDLAAKGAPEGTLVISEAQTQGRGRKGRQWFSPPEGGIYISLILRPTISPAEAPKITLLTAVVVAETLLALTSLEAQIKWPNDILVRGRKLAGILTEMSMELDAINHVIVGLGLNVNTPRFPGDIEEKATSILIETGKNFPRIRLIQAYLTWYEKYYDIFQSRGFEPVIKRWKDLSDTIGQKVMVDVVGNRFVGDVEDVNSDGILILKDQRGNIHRILSGDITPT